MRIPWFFWWFFFVGFHKHGLLEEKMVFVFVFSLWGCVLWRGFLFLRDRCQCWLYSWLVWWASLCSVKYSENRKLRYKSAYFVRIFNIFFPMIRDSLCVSGNVNFNCPFYEIQLHLLCFLFAFPFFVFVFFCCFHF